MNILNDIRDWDELSMREKAAYIRIGVSNGYDTIDSIRLAYNEFLKGGPVLKKGGWYNKHKDKWNTFLLNQGLSIKDANRLSGFFAALDGLESAGGTSNAAIKHNNYGGMQKNGRNIHYNSMNDYMLDKWNMMNNRFSSALKARTIEEFGTILGDPSKAGKGFLYYVADGYNSKDPLNKTWVARQNAHMNNYIAGMQRYYGSSKPRKVMQLPPLQPHIELPDALRVSKPVINTSLPPNILLDIEVSIPKPIIINSDEDTALEATPEIVVTAPKNVLLTALLNYIEGINNISTPLHSPLAYNNMPSIYDRMLAYNNGNLTLLLRDLENNALLEERRKRLGYSYRDGNSEELGLLGNISENGGYLYPNGGLLGEVKKGDKVDTDLCAEWSNGLLRDDGYLISGNAWNLNHVDSIFNGFEGLAKPEVYDNKLVNKYNHSATDNVLHYFDSKTLDTSKPYVVNMYYNNSPALETAYNEGNEVVGTHTGLLTYDDNVKKWMVTHNIHGTIHQEPFINLLNSKGNYGVTAIYAPRKNTIWNRVKGAFGFANGGPLINMFLNGGPEINWPALGSVKFGVYPDSTFVENPAEERGYISTFTPNLVKTLWLDEVNDYEANRIVYPNAQGKYINLQGDLVNPAFNQNSIIYNPLHTNRDAISLDALHIMHDNPVYEDLYNAYVEAAHDNNAIYDAANDEFGQWGMEVLDKYYRGKSLSKEELEIIRPIFDGFLRRQFAPSYMQNTKGGYEAPVDLSNTFLGNKVLTIKDYMLSYPLKEVIITGKKRKK